MSRKFDMIIRGTIEIPDDFNPMEMNEAEIAEYIGKNFGDFQYNGEAVYASMPELTEEEIRKGIEKGVIVLDDSGFCFGGVDDAIGCDVSEYIRENNIDKSELEDDEWLPKEEMIKLFNSTDECAKNYSLSDLVYYESEEGYQRDDELRAYEGLQGLGFFSK